MNNQVKKRLSYIDSARGLGIILIALGHISYVSNPVVIYGNSFKLAIFYIISGYLFSLKKDDKINKKSYIFSRLQKLGIPYVFFSILIVIRTTIGVFARGTLTIDNLLDNILRTVSLRGVGALWFLPSLFIAELLFVYIIKNCNKSVRIILLIILPLFCYILVRLFNYENIDISNNYILLVFVKSIIAVWFYSIGYYYLENLINLSAILLTILGVINILLSLQNTGVDLNNFQLGKYPLYFFVSGIIGSIIIIRLFKALSNHLNMHILRFCGKHSLFIMATHGYIYPTIVRILKAIVTFESATIGYYVFCFISLSLIFTIEAIIIRCWEYVKAFIQNKLSEDNIILKIIKYI